MLVLGHHYVCLSPASAKWIDDMHLGLNPASLRWPLDLSWPHTSQLIVMSYSIGHIVIVKLSEKKVPGRTGCEEK